MDNGQSYTTPGSRAYTSASWTDGPYLYFLGGGIISMWGIEASGGWNESKSRVEFLTILQWQNLMTCGCTTLTIIYGGG
jgi:hypothetical protein